MSCSNSRTHVALHGCWTRCCIWNQCWCECNDGLYGSLSYGPHFECSGNGFLALPRMTHLANLLVPDQPTNTGTILEIPTQRLTQTDRPSERGRKKDGGPKGRKRTTAYCGCCIVHTTAYRRGGIGGENQIPKSHLVTPFSVGKP